MSRGGEKNAKNSISASGKIPLIFEVRPNHHPFNLEKYTHMCGIVGYIGEQNAADIILNGLKNLEYRGYDSAGIATCEAEELHSVRAKGKLVNLEQELKKSPLKLLLRGLLFFFDGRSIIGSPQARV